MSTVSSLDKQHAAFLSELWLNQEPDAKGVASTPLRPMRMAKRRVSARVKGFGI